MNIQADDRAPADFGLFSRVGEMLRSYMSGERGGGLMWQGGDIYRLNAVKANEHEKDPYLKGGKITRDILSTIPAAIEPTDIFAAGALTKIPGDPKITEEWRRRPEAGYCQSNLGHISLNYAKAIKKGVKGLMGDIDSAIQKLPPEEKDGKLNFYESMKTALDGVLCYAANYREEAKRLSGVEPDENRKSELERITAALERVPFEPAETLFEAVQTMLLFHFAGLLVNVNSNMMGRVDFFLDEYYKKDIALGRVTPEEASEWMQYVYAKSSELVNLGDAVTIGGCDLEGRPFWNDLTYFILDALKALKHHQPQVGFRYAEGMPRELMVRAFLPLLSGVPQPGFFNDDICVAALERAGFETRDARDYVNCACVELSSYGRSNILSGYTYYNIAKPVETLLNNGVDMIEERTAHTAWPKHEFPKDIPVKFSSFEDFQESYRLYMGYLLKILTENTNGHLSRKPSVAYPLSSVLIDDCIEKGTAVTDGGARYKHTFPNFVGLVTAADSLSAIRQCVYEDKKLTLEELADLCSADFEGHEDIRLYLLNKCPKFGNGDKKADAMVEWVYGAVAGELGKHENIYGIKYAPCYFGEMQYVIQARHTAATPDGRRFGEAVTPTLGGDQGRDRLGLTALIESVTAFDHTLSSGGLSANFAISPLSFKSSEDVDILISALLTYFEKGGMQAQFNYVSADKLKDARKNPENHKNLLVRVAGFSGYFVNQTREIQNQIIERTEHALR
ncbi:MAG: hypothetical protein FWD23_07955 [Oscillospiraceae bacterium]|nr:hypothetical protein [Oscillospiraceae bacterium]